MGSNISKEDLKSWLSKNNWKYKGKTKHEHWIYEMEKFNISAPLSINFHITKGSGIKDYTLNQICNIMKISKKQLINSIREQKKYTEEELINFYLSSENNSISSYNIK